MAGKMYGKRHFLYTSATTCSGNRQIALNQFHGRLSGLERVSRLQRFCRHRTGFRQAQLTGDQARQQGVAEGGEGLGLLLFSGNAGQ